MWGYKPKPKHKKRTFTFDYLRPIRHYILPTTVWRGTSDDDLSLNTLRRNLKSWAVSRYKMRKHFFQTRLRSRHYRQIYRKIQGEPEPTPPPAPPTKQPQRPITPFREFPLIARFFSDRIGQSSEDFTKRSFFFRLSNKRYKFNPLI